MLGARGLFVDQSTGAVASSVTAVVQVPLEVVRKVR